MSAQPAQDPKNLHAVPDYEEPEDAALRNELDLRQVAYRAEGDDNAATGPCPDWCWVTHNEGYEHDVSPKAPFAPTHSMEPIPSVAASLYTGWMSKEEGDVILTCTATIEAWIHAEGSAEPVIGIGLRQGSVTDHRSFDYDRDRLRMTRDDTRDLIKVLTYILENSEDRP